MADQWAQKAFKPSHKGLLHRDLNVDPKKPIPASKMRRALKGMYGAKTRQRAQAAHNINE